MTLHEPIHQEVEPHIGKPNNRFKNAVRAVSAVAALALASCGAVQASGSDAIPTTPVHTDKTTIIDATPTSEQKLYEKRRIYRSIAQNIAERLATKITNNTSTEASNYKLYADVNKLNGELNPARIGIVANSSKGTVYQLDMSKDANGDWVIATTQTLEDGTQRNVNCSTDTASVDSEPTVQCSGSDILEYDSVRSYSDWVIGIEYQADGVLDLAALNAQIDTVDTLVPNINFGHGKF